MITCNIYDYKPHVNLAKMVLNLQGNMVNEPSKQTKVNWHIVIIKNVILKEMVFNPIR